MLHILISKTSFKYYGYQKKKINTFKDRVVCLVNVFNFSFGVAISRSFFVTSL